MTRWFGHRPDGASLATEDSDLELVEWARTSPAAFEPIVMRYRLPLLRYFHARLGDWDDAEDAAQEVLLDIYTRLPSFVPRADASFRSWLFTIAHHTQVDAQRKRTARRHEPFPAAPDWADPARSPEEEALRADAAGDLRRLLSSLTADQRAVVQLRAADLTTEEIASALHMTHVAVRKAQQRAFERLRALPNAEIESGATP